MENFALYYRPFPKELHGDIRGMITRRKNCYIILIDSSIPEQQQIAALKHELSHIALNHYNQPERDLEQCEAEAISFADKMTDPEFKELLSYRIN